MDILDPDPAGSDPDSTKIYRFLSGTDLPCILFVNCHSQAKKKSNVYILNKLCRQMVRWSLDFGETPVILRKFQEIIK